MKGVKCFQNIKCYNEYLTNGFFHEIQIDQANNSDDTNERAVDAYHDKGEDVNCANDCQEENVFD